MSVTFNSKNIVTLHNLLGQEADLHVVGGAVRDTLLNLQPKDIDLSTKFTPEQVKAKLVGSPLRVFDTGIRRNTITVVFPDGESFEVTTFRNPNNEKEVSNSVEEDLAARDFTINSIAFSLNTNQVVDPYQGKDNLKNPLMTVGDPEVRFKEDPHRILRMVRFGPGQGREVSSEVIEAAKKLAGNLTEVNVERIYPELVRIVTSEDPIKCLQLMRDVGILQVILPEILPCVGFLQNKYHKYNVFDHTCNVMAATPSNKLVRLAALFHDIGKPLSLTIDESGNRRFIGHENVSATMAKDILRRLKAPTADIESITRLVALHMKSTEMSKARIRKLKGELEGDFENWMVLKRADILGGGRNLDFDLLRKEWDDFLDKLEAVNEEPPVHKLSNLAVNGNDLLEVFSLKPGPNVGRLLSQLHTLVLEEPDMNTKEFLLRCAKELLDLESIA